MAAVHDHWVVRIHAFLFFVGRSFENLVIQVNLVGLGSVAHFPAINSTENSKRSRAKANNALASTFKKHSWIRTLKQFRFRMDLKG